MSFCGTGKTAPVTPKAVPIEPSAAMNLALGRLRNNVTNRPKKKKTLVSHLRTILGKNATDEEAAALVETLREAGHLSIGDKDAVTYLL